MRRDPAGIGNAVSFGSLGPLKQRYRTQNIASSAILEIIYAGILIILAGKLTNMASKATRGKVWSEKETKLHLTLWSEETIQIALDNSKCTKDTNRVYRNLLVSCFSSRICKVLYPIYEERSLI